MRKCLRQSGRRRLQSLWSSCSDWSSMPTSMNSYNKKRRKKYTKLATSCIANKANANPIPYPIPLGFVSPLPACSARLSLCHIYASVNHVKRALETNGVVVLRLSATSFRIPALHHLNMNVRCRALTRDESYCSPFLKTLSFPCRSSPIPHDLRSPDFLSSSFLSTSVGGGEK